MTASSSNRLAAYRPLVFLALLIGKINYLLCFSSTVVGWGRDAFRVLWAGRLHRRRRNPGPPHTLPGSSGTPAGECCPHLLSWEAAILCPVWPGPQSPLPCSCCSCVSFSDHEGFVCVVFHVLKKSIYLAIICK